MEGSVQYTPQKKRMKKSVVATIVFIVIALLLTFFSKTLYNLNLPMVHVASPSSGSLKRTYTAEAVIQSKKMYKLYAPDGLPVKQVLVKKGDYPLKGAKLVAFDVSALQLELKDLESQKRQLVLQKVKGLSGNAAKLQNLGISDKERAIEAKKKQITDDEALIAPSNGVVVSLNVSAGMTASGAEPAVVLGGSEDGYEVVLPMTNKQALWFTEGDKLEISIPSIKLLSVEGSAGAVTTADNGGAELHVNIDKAPLSIAAGQLASVSFTKMSDKFNVLIPVNALFGTEGSNFVFKVEKVSGPLGDEYRLRKVNVHVMDKDDSSVAVTGDLHQMDMVVTGSDRELFGGRVVLQKETESTEAQ